MHLFTRLLVTVASLALLGVVVPAAVGAQTRTLMYPPSDSAKDIAAALAAAKKTGTHVLLDFGADWCPDCRVLGGLFQDPAVEPFASKNFRIVHIDVGYRDKNAELVAKYKATSDGWIPAVVVLDTEGNTVAISDDKSRLTRRTTPQELLSRLHEWAPKARWMELAAFTERGVRVTLALERDSSGRLWLAGTFAPLDADTYLYGKDLPARGIDGLGRPTRLDVVSADGLAVSGAVIANRPVTEDRVEPLATMLPVYPAGAVTLSVPVAIDHARGSARADLSLGYMACGPKGCLPPVVDKRVRIVVPGVIRTKD